MKKKIIIIVGVLAALIIIAVIISFALKSAMPANAALVVEAERVKIDTVTSKIKTDGVVEFKDTSIIYAGTNAEIIKVNVEIGDIVNQDDIIIEYDKKALDDLKNQLSDAELNLKDSKIALQRAQSPADENEIKQAQIKINQSQSNIEEAQYRLKQLDSSIKQAQTNVDNAQKDYNTNKTLFDSGVISKDELDKYDKALVEAQNSLEGYNNQYKAENLSIKTAEENLEIAKTEYDSIVNKNNLINNQKEIEAQQVQVEKAELKISQLKKDIADFRINEKASVGGTVVKVSAKEGEIPSYGSLLVEIGNENDLIIKADIDEYDMKDISVGQSVEIKGDSFNGKINGTIIKIYPIAEEKEKYGSRKTMTTVEINIDKEKISLLKAGYTVKAEITTKTNENAKVIPLTALMTDKDGNDYVYVINDNNTVEKRDITLLSYADMYIETDGLEENEIVIIQPETVSVGQTVSPNIAGEDAAEDTSIQP